jgi:formate hydrogenlyase subunit 3/multisubunit Na+/H+ antiporter MnhD subunit
MIILYILAGSIGSLLLLIGTFVFLEKHGEAIFTFLHIVKPTQEKKKLNLRPK